MKDNKKLIAGILLVSGTTIGAGMLALPVLTGLGGFLPSLAIYFLCWLFMASTGLLFLEILQWMQKDANIISMAEKTLGFWGKCAAWILYLFLFYCLTLAYVIGSGGILLQLFPKILSASTAPILFALATAPLLYLGSRIIGKFNIVFMAGLAVCYIGFVILGLPFVDTNLLSRHDWALSLIALPVSFVAFAYQGIIPTLFNYMDHNINKTRVSILVGSFLPLILYIVWQFLILGIVPLEGFGGLKQALENGDNSVASLKYFISSPWVYFFSQFFAFFALVTSFFGVTLGLMDFLSDGLKIRKDRKGKWILCLLIYVPPILIAYSHPHLFLKALDVAGGYGSALLLGMLPILMVWVGRYQLGFSSAYQFPGGKWSLAILFLFVLFELGCELFFTTH